MATLRIDIVSIFPDYLDPLTLSLPGRARAAGVVDIRVHDLRDWAHDRHRTVDDTPAGGGPGMVMRPEPWGEALDALVLDDTTVVVPTPAGRRFTQALAGELSGRPHLLFVCGRYEGIDQRVIDHVGTVARVCEVSLGDYVLTGGEVAALAITEAVLRLLPGGLGNPASLAEESHADGLLEYPVYTKPASWRGRDVPPVLLSGDHEAIDSWRRDQALRRTVERRPDLAPASRVEGDAEVALAVPADAGELLTLTRACWAQEAVANDTLAASALHDSLADVVSGIATWQTYVARRDGRLVGSVRARRDGEVWDIGRWMVAPDLQGQGLGRVLLEHIQRVAPPGVTTFRVATGAGSAENLRRLRGMGFSVRGPLTGHPGLTALTKRRG